MLFLRRVCLAATVVALVLLAVGIAQSNAAIWQPAAVVAAAIFAVGLGAIPPLAGYQYTAWIVAAVVAGMIYPAQILRPGPWNLGPLAIAELNLQNPWAILVIVQLVMFGMGTKMSLRDFAGVVKMPYPVLIGVGLQFLVMPLTGYALARLFGFEPEIAAGLVLIGSCSSGLASNVMCYLAGANLALSITLTSVATLLAPVFTPFWMKTLAGEFIEVEFVKIMASIAKIVLIPIGAAMLHDYLKFAAPFARKVIFGLAAIAVVLLTSGYFFWQRLPADMHPFAETNLWLAAAIVVGVAYHVLARIIPTIDRHIHLVSMFGIIYFTTVATAAGRDHLLVVGGALFLAAILHNTIGYGLGYGLSRLAGLAHRDAITVGFEVGMQNGGMASGLAGAMGKLGTVGLAAAVFSPWMNVSGSVLANAIRRWSKNIISEEISNQE